MAGSGRNASDDLFASAARPAIAGGSAEIGGPFTLVSETGETVTDADVITMPTLLYFGYTFCPDVCPLDTVRNAEAVDILEQQGIMVQPVMITVDPERDTPEVMDDFTANVHPRMLGLTGTPEQTDAAARAYRVYYRINRDGDDPYYLVDHSAFAYLVLPEYGFVEFFNRDVTHRPKWRKPQPVSSRPRPQILKPGISALRAAWTYLARTTYTRQIDHPLHCSISCG
jgi:protein SCO1/2